MIEAEILVDYERFRSAKVAIFIESTNVKKAYLVLEEHGEAIKRLARLFSAKVFFVDESKLGAEQILDDEFADAWILLVSSGRNRTQATKKNPQRINVDTETDWEAYAFREILRQVRESTNILEDITSCYSRFFLSEDRLPPSALKL